MHDDKCELCSVKRHCKKPGNVKKCSVHKNIVELLKNPVTVKPTPTVEQYEQMLAIANKGIQRILNCVNTIIRVDKLTKAMDDAITQEILHIQGISEEAIEQIQNITNC